MPQQPDPDSTNIDRADREILGILAENPRIPYSEISKRLAEEDLELSSEAVRQRVSSLFDITSNFFLVRPRSHDWELLLVTIRTANHPGAKQDVFETMSEMSYWYVGSGFGTIDLYGFATVDSNAKIDALLERTRNQEAVTDMDYFIETKRSAAVEKYLQIE